MSAFQVLEGSLTCLSEMGQEKSDRIQGGDILLLIGTCD